MSLCLPPCPLLLFRKHPELCPSSVSCGGGRSLEEGQTWITLHPQYYLIGASPLLLSEVAPVFPYRATMGIVLSQES